MWSEQLLKYVKEWKAMPNGRCVGDSMTGEVNIPKRMGFVPCRRCSSICWWHWHHFLHITTIFVRKRPEGWNTVEERKKKNRSKERTIIRFTTLSPIHQRPKVMSEGLACPSGGLNDFDGASARIPNPTNKTDLPQIVCPRLFGPQSTFLLPIQPTELDVWTWRGSFSTESICVKSGPWGWANVLICGKTLEICLLYPTPNRGPKSALNQIPRLFF